MKNALFILAGATAISLASCSQEKTADTTTTTTVPADGAVTTSTTTDETYKMRGNRMADKFASDMKITDEPTKEKLRTAYYNRSKRYDAMHQKYMSDTTGMAADMRQYNTDTDQEFQGVLTQPAQYQAYQSSRSTYDEANNLDTNGQTAGASSATMPADGSSSMSDNSNMNNSSTSGSNMSSSDASNNGSAPTTASGVMRDRGMLDADNNVAKSKVKLENGAKVKTKDGDVKVKTADGEKTKL